jgi:hypothetical protein
LIKILMYDLFGESFFFLVVDGRFPILWSTCRLSDFLPSVYSHKNKLNIYIHIYKGPLVFGTVYIHSSSHSQASRKSFFVLIAGLELTNLTLINFVKTSVHDDSNPTTTTSAADLEEG